MIRNIDVRLQRLERVRQAGAAILLLSPGETEEQGRARYLAEHPGGEPSCWVIIDAGLL